jgi:hypothetical protein
MPKYFVYLFLGTQIILVIQHNNALLGVSNLFLLLLLKKDEIYSNQILKYIYVRFGPRDAKRLMKLPRQT